MINVSVGTTSVIYVFNVKVFDTFTGDYHRCNWKHPKCLSSKHIQIVHFGHSLIGWHGLLVFWMKLRANMLLQFTLLLSIGGENIVCVTKRCASRFIVGDHYKII